MTAARSATLGVLLGVLLCEAAHATKVETWRQDSPSAFAKARKERVVVSDLGRVTLGRKLTAVDDLDATHVWSLVRVRSNLYAATGSAGRVYRREGDGPWTLAYKSEDTQALSLAAMPDGRVFCGTGPTGSVVEVTDPKAPIGRPDASVKYIWGLASDASGNLYAATGPTGRLWKRDPAGTWSLLLDTKHPHLLCVAVAPDGTAFAGSDGEGLIYKVEPNGKASIVYDAPQNEVRCLLLAADGTLYAGTAAEAGGGPAGTAPRTFPSPNPDPAVAARPSGGTASPRPSLPGENAAYRIDPDGTPREVFRTRALIYSLAMAGDRLLVGTGPEGQVFEVRDSGRESAAIARLEQGQALAMLAGGPGDVLIGSGDAGRVYRLDAGYVASGTITSDIHDAKLVSKFGAVAFRSDRPARTSIRLQLRTGNVGEPDGTWSEWSPPIETDGARPSVPPGRFAQYRATLTSEDPSASPVLQAVAVHYQTANLAPEIARIVVPDASAADGSPRPPRMPLRWEVSDPNDDELAFTLWFRKEGWPDWIKLAEPPANDRTYAWDTTTVPAGHYRLKLSASDRPSNPPEAAMVRDLIGDPFVVDHQAPGVAVNPEPAGVKVELRDDLTRLVKAAYALDGGEWQAIFPDDGLFDSPREAITLKLAGLKPGLHVVTVRATDAAGNLGTGDAVVKAP